MSNRSCCHRSYTDSRSRSSPSVSRRIDTEARLPALRPAPGLRLHCLPHVAAEPASAMQTEVPARLSESVVRASGIDNPGYVGPNIRRIMLSSDLCDVQHPSADKQRVPAGRTSHKLARVEPGTSAGQDCRANVFAVAAVWLHTFPAPSPSSPDRFPRRYSSCRLRRGPAMRGSC